jgi:hypothetical protein
MLRDFEWFMKLVRARYSDIEYVATMEPQKRGAWHMHFAVGKFYDVNFIRACWHRVVGADNGNVDVAKRHGRFAADNPDRISAYIGKYIGKDFDVTPKGARRFFGSKGRAKPRSWVWWIEGRTREFAFRSVFEAVAGTNAVGVRQWLAPSGDLYFVSSARPPGGHDDCPF